MEVDGAVVIPLRQGEALWLAFSAASWKPNAVQVGVGGVNAVSGGSFTESLDADPQNYVVAPDQLWLDGINSGDATVRQFVAAPLGSGVTVEGQVTGSETHGGIQLRVFEPVRGRFPSRPPPPDPAAMFLPLAGVAPVDVGVAAGGRMKQRIHPDPYGLDAWDLRRSGEVDVRIVNTRQFRGLTGREAPASPIDARAYTEHGFPWFELYDADAGDVTAAEPLAGVKSVGELTGDGAEPVDVDPAQVRGIGTARARPDRAR